MNKQIVVLAVAAFFGMVACASIEGEDDYSFAGNALEDAETANLMGDEMLFSDFCHAQRAYVLADSRATARGAAADLFRQMFSSLNDMGDEVLNVEKAAVEQLANQLETGAPVDISNLDPNEKARAIEQGRQEIVDKIDQTEQSMNPLPKLAHATKAALTAMYSAINSSVLRRIAKARTLVSPATLLSALNQNCERFAAYEQHIKESLEGAKSEIAESNKDPKISEFLRTVSVNSLHCLTTKNVVRLNAFCELFKSGRGPFMKMLGIAA